MRPGDVGVVDDDHIPLSHRLAALLQIGERVGDANRQRAKMHGDMLGLGDQPALLVEERAGVIEPLFDVGRKRGVAHDDAHLFAGIEQRVANDLYDDGVERWRLSLVPYLCSCSSFCIAQAETACDAVQAVFQQRLHAPLPDLIGVYLC